MNVLKRWFKLNEQYSPALDIYYSVLFKPPGFLEAKFLLLAQALKSFLRTSNFNQEDIPMAEFKELK